MEVEVLTVKFYNKRTLKHKKLFLTGESCIISQWLENNSEDSNKEKKESSPGSDSGRTLQCVGVLTFCVCVCLFAGLFLWFDLTLLFFIYFSVSLLGT